MKQMQAQIFVLFETPFHPYSLQTVSRKERDIQAYNRSLDYCKKVLVEGCDYLIFFAICMDLPICTVLVTNLQANPPVFCFLFVFFFCGGGGF